MSWNKDELSRAALLVLPRLRVQNANAISSSMTWGFPSITAFTGLMTALERRLGSKAGITFNSVGVICHGFEAQVTQGKYHRSLSLKKPSIARDKEIQKYLKDGTPPSIVEEGQVHLDITLVFEVKLAQHYGDDAARAELAAEIGDMVAGMRIAGGSVMPPLTVGPSPRRGLPQLTLVGDKENETTFKRLSRRWLPGFALVLRDDVLHTRFEQLRDTTPMATLLDAWLDLSRINHRATQGDDGTVTWQIDKHGEGWLVPIPVGYAALTPTPHPAGTVAGARNPNVPFQFVESVYSIGQWISPHRLDNIQELMWRPTYDPALGLYRCVNNYKPSADAGNDTASDDASFL